MGTHRARGRSRGVSKGPVIALVAVVVLAVAVVGWSWLAERAKDRDAAAAAACAEGTTTLHVTVDPDIAEPVRAAAQRYNATNPRVRDHCAQVEVTARASAAVVAAFTADAPWNPELGPQPALWIPDSSRSVALMRVPGLVEGTPAPVAVSPIALAVPDQLRRALEAAQTTWADLPGLQQGSLAEVGLGGWGGLRLAMPPGDDSLAAALAVGSGVSGSDPLTAEAASSGQVTSAISRLAAGAPEATDLGRALLDAAGADDLPAATVHAVTATEQRIKANRGLTAFRPLGATPVADYPAALLTGDWVDQTQNLVAGLFADYLRAPEQAKLFTDNGFGAAPPAGPPVPEQAVLLRVQEVLANPVLGVSATTLVDVSSSMATTEGAATRLANTLAALQSVMNVMPPDFGLGVWTFGKNLDGNQPYRVVSRTAPLTDAHRAELVRELSDVSATSTQPDRAYPTLEAAYRDAVANYAPGRTNSILLVTDGPDDDSPVTGDQLLATIAALADPARPVRIDVIAIGGQGPQTLRTLTEQTNGTFTQVPTTDELAFGSAMNQALTTP
ncbi:VWA domain-containing protein [Nocardia otitidiscaviarum]|uniref:VWA domain-containing protein n=1 Tax=Nocardia otitidiscaviarum TaxID=1823 RepID=UPI0018936C29|nr:substrate-binding domain-containing protein [Nocardia otitidiscaviarum]MBF6180315.1 VWA domain-containing protein [Nocardia otitidiscaviarum]